MIMNTHAWAGGIAIHGFAAVGGEFADAFDEGGCYMQDTAHKQMVAALEATGEYIHSVRGDGSGAFSPKVDHPATGDGTYGIAYARSEDEPECTVWWFFDERPGALG